MASQEDKESLARYDDAYDPETHRVGAARAGAEYAALLYERGEEADLERAALVTRAVIDLQINDPSARTHGQFPMRADGSAGDLNAALFIMPGLIRLLESGLAGMPGELAAEYEACVRRTIVAAERRWDEERFDLHRDYKGYTNIFLIYIRALLLAGNHYKDERLIRQATAQWQRWFNHISYYGIDEFVSPTYGNVDYDALKPIHERCQDEQVRRESESVLDYLSAVTHAVTHPTLRLQVCGSSRNYRRFLRQDDCEAPCVKEGTDSPYTSQAIRDEYRSRTYPCTVKGRATAIPFRYQSWQDRNAAMGSMTGGNYFHQQIHCMVAVGENERDRAVLFIPGAYTPTSGFVSQQDNSALCLFTRVPNSFSRTQRPMPDEDVHAFKMEFGIGVTSGWSESESGTDGLKLSAYGHDVYIRPFELVNGQAQPVSLPRVRQTDIGQGKFHPSASDFVAYMFDEKAVWFGCTVTVQKEGTAAPVSTVTCSDQDGVLTLLSSDGPSIRLHQHASGEVTELYEEDWRTMPLFESPAQILQPGELTHRAANVS